MKDWQSQAYVKWNCVYHVVIVLKYRRKVFFGKRNWTRSKNRCSKVN